jgi:DNA-binding sugar fermentation-stimulating protein
MEQKTLTHFSAIHIKRLTNTTSESVHALACLEAINTWDHVLIFLISNKMDPEFKQLWTARIPAVENTYEMLITF